MLSREIKDKLKSFETPFYLYDMELLKRTVEAALSEADRYGYLIHYAMKANNDRRIMDLMHSYGLGADCVSGNEVKWAIECGFPASKIVFAGVGKKDNEIIYALEQGIFSFNCESREELEVINALAGQRGIMADVALRINPNVDPQTHKYITTGKAENKFGISYKEIEEVIASLADFRNVNITGIHFHIGSQITKMDVFRQLATRVNSLYRWFTEEGFNLTFVNLGGGLGIDYESPELNPVPDFESYFAVFSELLDLPAHVDVHFELGRSLVAQCGELISTVIYTKVNGDSHNIALVDASMTELIRPALYQSNHSIENLNGAGRKTADFTIGGTVCESSDIFAESLSMPLLKRGDLVSIKSTGAYGSSMASRYNMHDLPLSVYSDEL